MKNHVFQNRPHLIPALATAGMLAAALADWPYAYYQLLRLVTCGVAIYIAVTAHTWQKIWAVWLFGFIAVLFNPLIPIHLDRELWAVIDLACAGLFIVIAALLKKPVKEDAAP